MTKASKLIGIEINEWFAKLQQEFITKKFKMNDRVEVCSPVWSLLEYIRNENDQLVSQFI